MVIPWFVMEQEYSGDDGLHYRSGNRLTVVVPLPEDARKFCFSEIPLELLLFPLILVFICSSFGSGF